MFGLVVLLVYCGVGLCLSSVSLGGLLWGLVFYWWFWCLLLVMVLF